VASRGVLTASALAAVSGAAVESDGQINDDHGGGGDEASANEVGGGDVGAFFILGFGDVL
jgi:hypothetical protein